MCYRVDMTRCDIFWQFYCKVMAEWPWSNGSRSKLIMRATACNACDHLGLIWKESFQHCGSYRADTEYGTDGRSETNIHPQLCVNQHVCLSTVLIQRGHKTPIVGRHLGQDISDNGLMHVKCITWKMLTLHSGNVRNIHQLNLKNSSFCVIHEEAFEIAVHKMATISGIHLVNLPCVDVLFLLIHIFTYLKENNKYFRNYILSESDQYEVN